MNAPVLDFTRIGDCETVPIVRPGHIHLAILGRRKAQLRLYDPEQRCNELFVHPHETTSRICLRHPGHANCHDGPEVVHYGGILGVDGVSWCRDVTG